MATFFFPHALGAKSVWERAVMHPPTLRGYATDAGFSAVEILPTPFDFWYFYRLVG
jgi:hypothetical protein